jgi:hypothetical protein
MYLNKFAGVNEKTKSITISIFLFFGLMLYPSQSSAGDNPRKEEVQIKFDNDFLVPVVNTDKYYTYGLKFYYRKRLDFTTGIFHDLDRLFKTQGGSKILEIELGQEAYTPGNFKDHEYYDYDRPFAGRLYLGAVLTFTRDFKIFRLGSEIGILGPYSAAGKVQNYFHEHISHDDVLEGWKYQVENNPDISFELEFYKTIIRHAHLDVTMEHKIKFGTQVLYYQGGGRIRIGKFNPISNSITYHTSLSGTVRDSEIFIDFLSSLQFIGYNGTLRPQESGTAFYRSSEMNDIKPIYSAGINYNIRRFGASLRYFFTGGDLIWLEPHRYGSLNLMFRF